MIKSNELRIGNLITGFDEESEVFKVEKIDSVENLFNANGLYGLSLDDVTGVPLTEWWLLKFGFEKALNGWWDISENYSINLNDYLFRCGTEIISLVEIKYVHQLQNLYFALTGKELSS